MSGQAGEVLRGGRTVRRALLSVYDKTGAVELAAGLAGLGWELLSSGGTARALAAAGLEVTDTAEYTGAPPMLGHRVVTLHPKIHGGILADRSDPEHLAEMERYGVDPIDLVVVNFYPFGVAPGVETIDVGGPALVRAAAKNHAHVGVVVDPADYGPVLGELRAEGRLSDETRRRLARTAFARTAAFDAEVAGWLDAAGGEGPALFPPTIHLTLERAEMLRYGENPGQPGARYRRAGAEGSAGGGGDWWDAAVQLGGMPLSYLNLLDAGAAWALVHELGGRPAAAVIKHAGPCGAVAADDLSTAVRRAVECDPRAAFGGVVALNRTVDAAAAAVIEGAPQADVVIAPGYADGAAERIKSRRANTRILAAPPPGSPARTLRQIEGGWLAQAAPGPAAGRGTWRTVTRRRPDGLEDDAEFAWAVCGRAASNAAVMAKDGAAWGIGSGQQDRVGAVDAAAARARGRAAGGVCASDGFFPFPDGVESAARAGVSLVIQPGGSVNDAAVIEAADRLGLAMVFTGERRFRH